MKKLSDYLDLKQGKILEQVKSFESDKLFERLNPEKKEYLFKKIYYILKTASYHSSTPVKDLLGASGKHDVAFLRGICQYQIVEETHNLFGDTPAKAIGKLFGRSYESIMWNFSRIGNLKINSFEGSEAQELINLFNNYNASSDNALSS